MKARQRVTGIAVLVTAAVTGSACGSDASRARPPAGAESAGPVWREGPRLPAPVSNNGVAAVSGPDGVTVLSFLGIDSTKTWSGVTSAAYRWDFGTDGGWRAIDAVPGPGRLAPTVEVLAGRVFAFGGYTVAEDGSETSTPFVNVYTPRLDSWGRAADIPLPVDDAVSGVWGRSLVYLVSGWHDGGNVADVQVFDATLDLWTTATPTPGPPVFGHSGAVAGGDIVYVGGAEVVEGRPRFVASATAWRARIDPAEPSSLAWEEIDPPPGGHLYRAAAASADGHVILVGGTNNPYNYDGVGYDGAPSEPVPGVVAWSAGEGWRALEGPPVATMDHRNLAVAGGYVFLVGGMTAGRRVSDRVFYAEVDALLASSAEGR